MPIYRQHFGQFGYWSAHRGACRIVYRLDHDAHTVQVVRIEHRSDVYRPR